MKTTELSMPEFAPDVQEKLQALAAKKGGSISAVVRDAIEHAEKHDDQWDWDLNDVIAEMFERIAALEAEMAKLKTLPVINYSGIMREGE